ncbi:MAG: carbohydrate-binding family 9-like protein [Myxococcales bacterium]|nr:carbohydrate-binding family 9-like protein [Myxococcales bacterium]MCB9708312.1 carbohydrate-binding family 9-like protein [Myxococcales bacterium]
MTLRPLLILGALMLTLSCGKRQDPQGHATGKRAVSEKLPKLRVPRILENLEIDGQLDEAAWQHAAVSTPFVNTMHGTPSKLNVVSRWLWNETYLYVAFEVGDTFLNSTFARRDDHLWEQDAVEMLIAPFGERAHYYEIQVSPTGNVFDTRFDSRRRPAPYGHVDWTSRITAKVAVRGTVNDARPDRGYTVELGIPWNALGCDSRSLNGLVFRANLFVLDALKAGGQQACGWSPPLVGDFHAVERFGIIELVDS